MSKQNRTFAQSNGIFCFEVVFAQIAAKLPKISLKLIASSILNGLKVNNRKILHP